MGTTKQRRARGQGRGQGQRDGQDDGHRLRRRHGHCPVARTADLIATRWTPLILRDLFDHGARRYQHFAISLDGISPNTLSARLKALQAEGIVERRPYQAHPPRAEYLLTEKGRALGPVLEAMGDWGERYPKT